MLVVVMLLSRFSPAHIRRQCWAWAETNCACGTPAGRRYLSRFRRADRR
ncbi:hypothetical protein KCP78_01740 [Salmonella enterica subsp. enterica]|nr:hypothetical protein KCP78_01740 [Salmonella enterica subsp. enterica]